VIPWREVPAQTVAKGFGFVEAPSFTPEGVLFFSEVRAGVVHRLDVGQGGARAEGRAQTFHRVESGWCNGTAFHQDGRLFLCDVGAGCIWTLSPEGEATLFADRCTTNGQHLRGPNDLVFDRNGILYFTDPRGSSLEEPVGDVYRAYPDGRVERLDSGLAFPNGLALTPDESALIVAETRTQKLHRYAIGADGKVGPRELFCQLPQDGVGPDGMALAEDGRFFVTDVGIGCLDIVSPDGRVLERIPAGGARLSNCAFLGDALYCTVTQTVDGLTGEVRRLEVGVKGHPLFAGPRA
jgi:gluconolactonase